MEKSRTIMSDSLLKYRTITERVKEKPSMAKPTEEIWKWNQSSGLLLLESPPPASGPFVKQRVPSESQMTLIREHSRRLNDQIKMKEKSREHLRSELKTSKSILEDIKGKQRLRKRYGNTVDICYDRVFEGKKFKEVWSWSPGSPDQVMLTESAEYYRGPTRRILTDKEIDIINDILARRERIVSEKLSHIADIEKRIDLVDTEIGDLQRLKKEPVLISVARRETRV